MDRRVPSGSGGFDRYAAGGGGRDHLLSCEGRGNLALVQGHGMTDLRVENRTAASERLLAAAQRVLPGGVNSPVRAFRAVGGTPRFMSRGAGPWLEDVDGNRYLDLVLSWGPLILGHAHPEVLSAVIDAAGRGTTYGA